jgi:hypothetical protein
MALSQNANGPAVEGVKVTRWKHLPALLIKKILFFTDFTAFLKKCHGFLKHFT